MTSNVWAIIASFDCILLFIIKFVIKTIGYSGKICKIFDYFFTHFISILVPDIIPFITIRFPSGTLKK
jgi:hypothetical protein